MRTRTALVPESLSPAGSCRRPLESGVATRELPSSELVDGRYRIIGQLGAGAMGIVFRAEDVMLQRPAALKMIEPELARDPDAVDNFLREARALARLRHDNVVQIYAFGKSDDSYFFAMEYVDGEDLETINDRYVIRKEVFPLARALEILAPIASGLSAAHARDLVHRDVKPSNIVIERESGRPVLVDFGIARQLSVLDTRSSLCAGTPTYMAPEQVRNEKALISPKTDVYALACTAFELLVGRPVFEGSGARDLLVSQVSDMPPLVSTFRPEYAVFDAVFARALAKDPHYRHETCVAFVEELVEATRAGGLLGQPEPPSAGGTRVLLLAGVDGVGRAVVRELERSIGASGAHAAIEILSARSEVLSAFERDPAALVVLDDDRAGGASIEIAGYLRQLPSGEHAKIVVLTRDMLAERGVWDAVGAQRVAKPLSLRALGSVVDAVASSPTMIPSGR
jgi:eukaryotic-like serine/threonine-protein kinase